MLRLIEKENTYIREVQPNDIPSIATIHKTQLSDHFLGHYSRKMLERFYSKFTNGNMVFFVSEHEGSINGFVLGGQSDTLNRAKKQFIADSKFSILLETIRTPGIYLQFIKRIGIQGKKRKTSKVGMRLLSIAVANSVQGKGVATQLLHEFEKAILTTGTYGLSVNKRNERAIRFYYKNGFILEFENDDGIYLYKTIKSPV